jgi:hypothetical protein
MYLVVKYFNYRKDISLEVLKTFHSFDKANQYTLECAQREFGDKNVVEGVSEKRLELDDEIIDGFTNHTGYSEYVFSILEVPNPE